MGNDLVYTATVCKGWWLWTATVEANPEPPLIIEGGSRRVSFRSRTREGAILKARRYAKRQREHHKPTNCETINL